MRQKVSAGGFFRKWGADNSKGGKRGRKRRYLIKRVLCDIQNEKKKKKKKKKKKNKKKKHKKTKHRE